ncbi:EDD domain protein, DegV family [Lachnospiraceae bacterium oral taxon 082 str. F0431]|jgi:EDD domain protein, degV family|nr:EDD domain protein, DegV family [Lachnospiraceae bacterium oral taxon 082 str. F0431]
MSTAVVLDSNCGLTGVEAKKYGMYILPMPFMIDGKEYLDGIDITREEFLKRQEEGVDIVTSQPSPENVMDLWDELLKTYDSVIHIPMTSGLSGSCDTATMLASEDEYVGRVFVVDDKRISVTQISAGLDALTLIDAGFTPDKIKEKLEADALKSGIYVMVSDIKYLKKGGRITPMAAALASLLKIKPVLQLHEGKIDAYAKARTFKQAKQIMVEAIKKDLSERLKDPMCKDSRLMIAQYGYLDFAKEFASELEAEFGKVETVNLSLSVATHIGPGTVALAVARKISTD